MTKPIVKFDSKGNVTHFKDSLCEFWYEYDEDDNLSYRKDSVWCERLYYANGNVSRIKYSDNCEEWFTTDGKQSYSKLNNHFEYWSEYDENGNLSYQRTSEGLEEWYDSEGNTIHIKDKSKEVWNEYNSNGDISYERNSNGVEEWYDNRGKLIRYKDSDGYEELYDEDGNTIITSKVCEGERPHDSSASTHQYEGYRGLEVCQYSKWHSDHLKGS